MRTVMMAAQFHGSDEDYAHYLDALMEANDPQIMGSVTVLDREVVMPDENASDDEIAKAEELADATFNVADGLVKHFAELEEEEVTNRP